MAKFPGLKVAKRELLGRKVKALRRQGIIPANLFGNKITSIAIQVDEKNFTKIYNEVGETGIVEVELNADKYPSLIAGYASDPVTGKMLHVDFHHVSLKEKVTATIPVHVIGEAPAVKEQGGVLNTSLHEIEVEALPTDLPEAIEVDVTGLVNIGDMVTVAAVKVPEGVELKVDLDTVVVTIAEPAKEEVVEAPAEAEGEAVPETAAEGEAPAAPAEAEPKAE